MATLLIAMMALFFTGFALALFSASVLFMVRKHRWNDAYMMHRRAWMPNWCWPCASLWIAVLPALALALVVSPLAGLALAIVPPMYNLVRMDD